MQNQGNIDDKFWKDYYQKWDKFVEDWYDQIAAGQAEPQDEISQAYKQAVVALEFDELPTPYLGSPHKGVDAVIINLNPGLSDKNKAKESLDATMFYRNIDSGEDGWLIKEFRDKAGCKYSRFIGNDDSRTEINWSCLNPKLRGREKRGEKPVCGVKWWQGDNPKFVGGKRLPWLSRIYGKTILPERVFALELCPYHSKNFSLDDKNPEYKKVLTEFISQYVIQPAAKAVIENNLPFAVAVGADNAHILEQVGARHLQTWEFITGKDKKGKDNYRIYKRYAIKTDDGQTVDIVVTWQRMNQGVPAPDIKFSEVEKQVFYTPREQLDGTTAVMDLKTNRQHEKPQPKKMKLDKKSSARGAPQTIEFQFWRAFKGWCEKNGKTWCRANVKPGTYYDPNGQGGKLHIFFKLVKQQIASFKSQSDHVAIGINCHQGEDQRNTIAQYKNRFSELGELQDWTYAQSKKGSTGRVNIYFARKADWGDSVQWEKIFAQMAKDYEKIEQNIFPLNGLFS